jgi:hypothetical protein
VPERVAAQVWQCLAQDALVQDDATSALLAGLEDRLRLELGHSARVERSEFLGGEGTSWAVHPVNPGSAPVQWWAFGDEIGLQAGRKNRGGRWELECAPEDVEFVEAVVRATIAGNIAETSALARSLVEVTLEDGQVVRETGYAGCLTGLLPLPGWRRWGKVVHFAPYASP